MGVKKGPAKPISVNVSGSIGGTRDQPPMTHPHNDSGLATPPIGAGRGCAPAPAGPGVPVSIWPGLPAPASDHSPVACPGPITAAAAAKAIAAFSRPGDLVAAPDG